MTQVVHINREAFDRSIRHFWLSSSHIENMAELEKLRSFPALQSASFSGTNLDDAGLELVSRVETLENLDLQETQITNDGLVCLENLPRLQYLRLKGNTQLDNGCVSRLLRLVGLVDLGIHETAIDENGLRALVPMTNLRDICLDVWNGNYSFEALIEVSTRMPACRILAKGHGEFFQGKFDGSWKA